MQPTRRKFIASSALASVGMASAITRGHQPAMAAPTETRKADREHAFGAARRVIFAVSDGMSTGTLTLADMYSKIVAGTGETNWVRLFRDPRARHAMCSTHCSDSLVTDSAAASTTWSCGKKVYRGSIGFNDEREIETPILLRARGSGFGTGLVTTASLTDATPAGFIANVPARGMEREIAQQILDRKPTVALGGGSVHFDPKETEAFTGHYVTNHRALGDRPQAESQIGVFAERHMPYVLDRSGDDADLESMTRDALRRLDQAGDGFLVQVEAARVDHAAHANDAVSTILEQLEFDRTLGRLIEYTESRDDTLLIITTDHGNANPGLTVYGERGERGLRKLADSRRSFSWIAGELRDRDPDVSNVSVVREIIEFATGVALEDDDIARLGSQNTRRANLFGEIDNFTSRLGSLLANHNGIGFVSKNHTSDLVHVTALGAGADLLKPMIDNTALMPIMMHAMGIASMATP